MPRLLAIAVTATVFVGVLLVVGLVGLAIRARRESRSEALARRLGLAVEPEPDPLLAAREPEPLGGLLGEAGDRLRALLQQADVDYDLAGLAQRMAMFATGGLLFGAVLLRSWAGLAGLALGLLPLWQLRRRARKRAIALAAQLPDALDLIARSLQAGHGLGDAMRLCAEEMPDPVAREFGRVYEEHNLGRDLRDCLNRLAERNPGNFDLHIFVSSVLLQRDTGGNLVEILENISKTIRDRFVFQAKVRALTAETRTSALILGALPFVLAVLISFVRPDYLRPLFTDPIGMVGLGGAFGWFVVGILVMRGLTKVEV